MKRIYNIIGLWPDTSVVEGSVSQREYENRLQSLVEDWTFEMCADRRISPKQLQIMLDRALERFK